MGPQLLAFDTAHATGGGPPPVTSPSQTVFEVVFVYLKVRNPVGQVGRDVVDGTTTNPSDVVEPPVVWLRLTWSPTPAHTASEKLPSGWTLADPLAEHPDDPAATALACLKPALEELEPLTVPPPGATPGAPRIATTPFIGACT